MHLNYWALRKQHAFAAVLGFFAAWSLARTLRACGGDDCGGDELAFLILGVPAYVGATYCVGRALWDVMQTREQRSVLIAAVGFLSLIGFVSMWMYAM